LKTQNLISLQGISLSRRNELKNKESNKMKQSQYKAMMIAKLAADKQLRDKKKEEDAKLQAEKDEKLRLKLKQEEAERMLKIAAELKLK